VHNHPFHVTVLSALGMVPDVLHQTGCLFDQETGFVDEYTGEIDSASFGADLADRIGGATVVVLANHGVIVTAPTLEEAAYKTAAFERQCRLAYDVLLGSAAGRPVSTIPAALRPAMKHPLLERVSEVYWNGWIRRLLRTVPETFDGPPARPAARRLLSGCPLLAETGRALLAEGCQRLPRVGHA
jgi:hypothetical protein